MRLYIAKRILFFIPAVLLVVLFSFILLQQAPGNPVDRLMNLEGSYENEMNPGINNEAQKKELSHRLGLDLPVFYWSIKSLKEHRQENNVSTSSLSAYIPYISFHPKNQFHRWLLGDGEFSNGIIHGDFGISWITGQSVYALLSPRIKWSFLFSLIAILFAYLISIPAGLRSAANPGSRFDRWSTILFMILFSLPVFWFATILMLVFCNPDVMNILPSSGVSPAGGFLESATFPEIFFNSIPYLILPTICYTYGSLAFLSGSVKASVGDILKEDYIRTARAKGLSEKTILYRHAFRNALLPLISIFSHVLPMAVSGSVIIETIFTIPGMGLAIFQSLSSQDYPVIITVFMITGVFTMAAFLISDIVYALVDPRISFNRNSVS
jgi:ABC-type dipeptide/oligopeptide/nickel transport system permease component